MSPLRSRSRVRGFTLVEMSVVVVIVAILAVLGVVGYRRYKASARMHEATMMIGNIKAAQAEFKAETGIYAQVSNSSDDLYPSDSPGSFVTQWGGPCNNCVDPNAWQKLKVQAPSPVMYGYSTVMGVGSSTIQSSAPKAKMAMKSMAMTSSATSSAAPSIGTTDPWYIATAKGDMNGDGVMCVVMGLSASNDLVISDEGE